MQRLSNEALYRQADKMGFAAEGSAVNMRGKWNLMKNIGWAIGIGLSFLALFVGLIVAGFTRYEGELERGGVQLGGQKAESAVIAATPAPAAATGEGELLTVPETADAGQAYIDSLTFLCDGAIIGLRDYGLLSGGSASEQIWATRAGNVPADSLADFTIIYPGDGSIVSPASAAMITKPGRLVITLSSDSLGDTDRERFIADYTKLVKEIQSYSPNTVIILCSLTGVTPSYNGADGLNNLAIQNANEWIRQVCLDTGSYFADTASAVCDSSSGLMSEYASANGKTINSAGLAKILEYLRSHAV